MSASVMVWTFDVSVSNGSIKCPIGKSIFTVNLPLKLYCATVANADTASLKFLHTLFNTYWNHMLAKFEANRMVQNVQNCEFFNKKPVSFEEHFWQNVDAIL